MEPVTSASLTEFLKTLGQRSSLRTAIYLLGGSALSIMGNPRRTLDIDYTTDLTDERQKIFENLVDQVAAELKLDVEAVPLNEFIPLPPNANARAHFVAQYGNLEVYVFDLYSIALSKIARGFESDLEDVLFLLHDGLIDWVELEGYFQAVLPDISKADIDPQEFTLYFTAIKNRFLR